MTGRGSTDARSAAAVLRSGMAPDIDGERCVHGRLATATCRACVDACPRGAIVLSASALGIDTDACDGCGLCRPDCPEDAIKLEGVNFDGVWNGPPGAVLLACPQSGLDGPGVVPCLHAVSERDLETMRSRRAGTLITASVDCETCPCHTELTVDRAMAKVNAVATSCGRPALVHERVPAGHWEELRGEALCRRPDVDQSRRGLLAGILGLTTRTNVPRPESAGGCGRLYRYSPEIDALSCRGCDACLRICPHDAIICEEHETCSSYDFRPERCTGCRLCVDVCEPRAVAVRELSVAAPRVPLVEFRCSRCGVLIHRPERGDGAEHADCRICRSRRWQNTLFQVRS